MDSFCNRPFFVVLFLTMITIIPATSQPQSCKSYKFPNAFNFSVCNDLPFLDSSIYWNYHASSNTMETAFKKNNANHNDWIAWAINPTSKGMVGSQSFVAFKKSDGTVTTYTSPITTYSTKLEEGRLSLEVHGVSASFEDGDMIIYAKFQLPWNSTLVNHVWQQGSVSDDTPLSHALSGPNVKSFGQIDFLTGIVSDDDGGNSDESDILIRKVHGILSGIGWGILMPIGVIMARYLKAFEASGSSWFLLHRECQIIAYFTGTAGFALGIYMATILGQFSVHGYIGIAIFMASTAQVVVALNYRPQEDDRDRIFWNIFHYVIGYGLIVLAVFNIFRGFSIAHSYQTWKNAYFGILVSLGCVALVLEVVTWFLVCKNRKKKVEEENSDEH